MSQWQTLSQKLSLKWFSGLWQMFTPVCLWEEFVDTIMSKLCTKLWMMQSQNSTVLTWDQQVWWSRGLKASVWWPSRLVWPQYKTMLHSKEKCHLCFYSTFLWFQDLSAVRTIFFYMAVQTLTTEKTQLFWNAIMHQTHVRFPPLVSSLRVTPSFSQPSFPSLLTFSNKSKAIKRPERRWFSHLNAIKKEVMTAHQSSCDPVD